MSNSFLAIDSQQLQHVTGGAITAPRDLRTSARALDAMLPDEIGVQVGPVSAGWNLPERPFSDMLDHFKYKAPPPAKPSGNIWRDAASNAVS